jgi:hypothetical protein
MPDFPHEAALKPLKQEDFKAIEYHADTTCPACKEPTAPPDYFCHFEDGGGTLVIREICPHCSEVTRRFFLTLPIYPGCL